MTEQRRLFGPEECSIQGVKLIVINVLDRFIYVSHHASLSNYLPRQLLI